MTVNHSFTCHKLGINARDTNVNYTLNNCTLYNYYKLTTY